MGDRMKNGTLAQALDALKRDMIVCESQGWPRLTIDALQVRAINRHANDRLDCPFYFTMGYSFPKGAPVEGVRWFAQL